MLSLIPLDILKSIRITLVFGLIGGVIYPLVITGISQVAFHDQANGSLVMVNGRIVGSSLIGQNFSADKYFQGRLSYTSPAPYEADNSAGSNLGPSNPTLINNVASAARSYRQANGLGPNAQVPVDAVTGDFSGFDPDITEANALLQVNRVAQARNLDPAKVRALVEKYKHGRILWIFGEEYVNVLEVNLALDRGESG
ncbi:MAG TPA: potassium-transporting ATPase subunit KdpC [Candidatus Dormibacteraeota bacterium]|nr:potassium-transporting ATPase subunit KdpC [Candidatus Dormibacteraeota bacterium]